jgi:hypothetical protein
VAPPTGGAVELEYRFETQTDPTGLTNGEVRINNADPTLATEAYISMTTINGNRFQQLWQSFQQDDVMWFVDQAGGNTYGYVLTGVGTPNIPGDWDNSTYVTYPLGTNDTDGLIPDQSEILVTFLANPAARLPPGGLTGEALVKATDANFDTTWQAVLLEAPNDGWSHSRQWNGSAMEWNSHPVFEGPVGIGTTSPAVMLEVHNTASVYIPMQIRSGGIHSLLGFRDANSSGSYKTRIGSAGDDLTFWTADAQKMRITSAGNVGIGTTSPAFTLDVWAGNAQGIRVQNNLSGADNYSLRLTSAYADEMATIQAGNDNRGKIAFRNFGKDITFDTNGANERMRINSSGNVGIGTTSPEARLDVQHAAGAGRMQLRLSNTGGTNYWELGRENSSGDFWIAEGVAGTAFVIDQDTRKVGIGTTSPAYGRLEVKQSSDASNEGIAVTSASGSYTGRIWCNNNLFTLTGGGTGTRTIVYDGADHRWQLGGSEKMRIDSDGNVGIGTSSPVYPLSIYEVGGYAKMGFYSPETGSPSASNGFEIGISSGNVDALVWNREAGAVRFATNSAERMRINSVGNVGIGTTSPDQPLTIAGALGGYGIHVDSSTGAGIEIDRGGAANACGVYWQTAGADNWFAGTRSDSDSRFHIKQGNFDGTARLTISNAGNVGIGTTTPTYKLDVAGGVNVTDNFYINGVPISGGGGTVSDLGTTYTSTRVTITNTGGDNTNINEASSSTAGVMTAVMHNDLADYQNVFNVQSTYVQVDRDWDVLGVMSAEGLSIDASDPTLAWNDTGSGTLSNFGMKLTTGEILYVLGYSGATTSNKHFRWVKPSGTSTNIDSFGGYSGAVITGAVAGQVNSYMTAAEREAMVDFLEANGILTATRATQIKTKLAADMAAMLGAGATTQIN